MGRRLSVDRSSLQAAKAFCLRVDSPRAAVSRRVLEGLLASASSSAAQIAEKADCSRPYVFRVMAAAKDGQYEALTTNGRFRKTALLSDDQKAALTRKLKQGEFECAKDVQKWFGSPVALSTVHGWCRRLGREFGFSFRRLRRSRRSPSLRVPRPHRLQLVLSQEEVEVLRARQAVESRALGLGEGELRHPGQAGKPRRRTNPVLRIEAVLRFATSGQPIARIAQGLQTSRSEVRRWARIYTSEGIEGLCKVNEGGRPRTKTAKPVPPPAGKPKESAKPRRRDPKREEIEQFKARVIAGLEAQQRALDAEANLRR